MTLRLAFACPYYGPTQPLVHLTQQANIMNAAQDGHVWEDNYSTMGLQHKYACEVMSERAAKDDRIEAVFWTEHDVVLPGDAVQQLVGALEANPGADVVSGIVFRRCEPFNPMISLEGSLTLAQYEQMKADAASGKLKDERLLLALEVLDYPELARDWLAPLRDLDTSAPPFRMKAASMGCFLARRRVFEHADQTKGIFAVDRWGLKSIDTAFFVRLYHAGFKLYCQPSILCGHMSDPDIVSVNHYQKHLMKLVERVERDRTETIRKEHPEARIYGELTRLADRYGTDKGTLDHAAGSGWEGWVHNYTPFYEAVLASIRTSARNVLEIGVFHGASLKMWRDYFPNATIQGLDNWEGYDGEGHLLQKPEDLGERIVLIDGDQANRDDLLRLEELQAQLFDMICDDGGHTMEQQQVSLGYLFPLVRPGGYYIVEDLHTSTMGADFGVDPDGQNTTLHFLEGLQAGVDFRGKYMTPEEYAYLRAHVDTVMIHGKKSITAVLRKKAA